MFKDRCSPLWTVFTPQKVDHISGIIVIDSLLYLDVSVLRDLQAVPTIVFALLAGAWSDRYGRLFVILIPLASFIIRDVVFIVISLFEVVLLVESTLTTST